MDLTFTEAEIDRYSRNILLAEIGGTGQARLRAARVLVVGAGGLGCPLALYLAAAGVGTIGIVDPDRVELSNLQRQIAHTTGGIGASKAGSLAAAIAALNPLVRVQAHAARFDRSNAASLVEGYDLVCDATDDSDTRYLLNECCVRARRTLVSAAIVRFDGQLSTFRPEGPCYRCLYPTAAPPGSLPSCGEAGVLGAATGVLGSLQATEAIKLLTGAGDTLAGRLLLWDALGNRFQLLTVPRDPACPVCGPAARA